MTYVDYRQSGELTLQFVRGSYDDWKLFERYHYLSTKLFTASTVTLALIKNEPVAFVAVSFQMQHGRRIHRLVVLPEWQGLGIGSRLLEYVADEEDRNGSKVYIKTSHPAIGRYLESSNKWLPSTHNLKPSKAHPWYDEVRQVPCWCYKYNGIIKHLKLKLDVPPVTAAATPIITPAITTITPIIVPTPALTIAPTVAPKPVILNKQCNLTDVKDKLNEVGEPVQNSWDCLIRKGRIEIRKNSYAYIRKNYQTIYFNTSQEAYNAQTLSSIESGCNPYKIINNEIIIKIRNPCGSNMYYYAKVPVQFLESVKGRTWFIRQMATGPHARSKIDERTRIHVYLEDICGIPRKNSTLLFTEDPTV